MSNELLVSAAWGAAGGFIRAQAELFICLRVARELGHPRTECVFKFLCALMVGAIGASACGQPVAGVFHQTTPSGENMVALGIGLIANDVWPVLAKLAPKIAENMLSALTKRDAP